MNVMLHKRCARYIYIIPEGLRELMSDISREVIRSQPIHIYTFIADYLDALMITRENARVAARLVDSIIRIGATTVELLHQTGMTRMEADRMAAIIQGAFKQYMAVRKANVPTAKDEEPEGESEFDEEQDIVANIMEQYGDYIDNEEGAAEIIQRAFRTFKMKHDKEKELLSGMIDWRVAARSAIYLYRKTGVTHEEANRAATLIKAAYKGYYTRRIMKRLVEEGKMLYGDEAEGYEEEEEEYEEYHEIYQEDQGQLTIADYLDLMHVDSDEGTAPVTEADDSTNLAGSIMEDVLSMVHTESDVDQATATSWTEGAAGDQTYADDMDAESGDYTQIPLQEDTSEDATFTTGVGPTGEKSSVEALQTTEENLEIQEELQEGQEEQEAQDVTQGSEEAPTLESVEPLTESEKTPAGGDEVTEETVAPTSGEESEVTEVVTESVVTTEVETTDGGESNV